MINTIYPISLVFICLLIAATITFFLYYKSFFSSGRSFFSAPNIILAFLRFISFFLLSFFLLGPFIKFHFKKTEKPLIVVLSDNSQSVLLNKDSMYYRNEFKEEMDQLITKLSDRYEVKSYTFGEDLKSGKVLDYSEKRTNMAKPLNEIYDLYFNKNLSAIVLASDGNYNTGTDPIHYVKDFSVPFYTLGLGDTTTARDLLIGQLFYNSIAYLGNLIPLQINIAASKFKNANAELKVTHKGKVLYSETLMIHDQHYSKQVEVLIDAKEKGNQKYTISITWLKGEITYANNVRDIFIDILESKKKVVILANSPHPDIGAFRRALNSNGNYDCIVVMAEEIETGKIKTQDLFIKTDLVILHQLPSEKYAIKNVFKDLEQENIPLLYIIGTQTSIPRINQNNTSFSIAQSKNTFEQVQALPNPLFDYFNLNELSSKYFYEFPPLTVPFGNYKIHSEHQIMTFQKIGQIRTSIPLIAFIEDMNKRIGVVFGEGIWRWPLTEYRLNGNQDFFNDLINKTVQLLSVKEDRRLFRLVDLKNSYYEDEPILFNAELLNKNFEKLPNAKIKLRLWDDQKKAYDFEFIENLQGYQAQIGNLPPGRYNYTASANVNEKTERLSGEILVREIDLEFLNSASDHTLLYRMASHNEGGFYYPSQMDELRKNLLKKSFKSKIYFTYESKDLIHLKWLFFIILSLFALEWFLRKYFGSY